MKLPEAKYRYKQAPEYIQILSCDDIMRMYSLMSVSDEGIWELVYARVNDRIFESFSELNNTIIRAIQEFQSPPVVGKKRGRDGVEQVQKRLKRCHI